MELGIWKKDNIQATLQDNVGVPDKLPPIMILKIDGQAAQEYLLLSSRKKAMELGITI